MLLANVSMNVYAYVCINTYKCVQACVHLHVYMHMFSDWKIFLYK